MIRNLTPHPVNLVVDGQTITLPPDGAPPRVSTTETPAGTVTVDGAEAPIFQVSTGELDGLPDQQPGVWLIVSRMVAEAAPHRRDLVIPHGLVRDGSGRVIGCSALGQVPPPRPVQLALQLLASLALRLVAGGRGLLRLICGAVR